MKMELVNRTDSPINSVVLDTLRLRAKHRMSCLNFASVIRERR